MAKSVRLSPSEFTSKNSIKNVELVDLKRSVQLAKRSITSNQVSLNTTSAHNFIQNNDVVIEGIPTLDLGSAIKVKVLADGSFQLITGTLASIGLVNRDVVIFKSGPPTNATANRSYYIKVLNTNTFELHDSLQSVATATSRIKCVGPTTTIYYLYKVVDVNSPYYEYVSNLASTGKTYNFIKLKLQSNLLTVTFPVNTTKFFIEADSVLFSGITNPSFVFLNSIDPNSPLKVKSITDTTLTFQITKANIAEVAATGIAENRRVHSNGTESEVLSGAGKNANKNVITYQTDGPHLFNIGDSVTISGTKTTSGTGDTSIFNLTNAVIVSVNFLRTNFTVNIAPDTRLGGAIGGTARVVRRKPFTVTSIPTPYSFTYNLLQHPLNAVSTIAIQNNENKYEGSSAKIYYTSPDARYFIRYTTELPHNLIAGDLISVYEVTPARYNFKNKIVTNNKELVTQRSFCIDVTFSESLEKNTNLYLKKIPVEPTDSDYTYTIGGFINSLRYFVRYRLVSDDSNQKSNWSKIFPISSSYQNIANNNNFDGGSLG
jgi:hypothetical protein